MDTKSYSLFNFTSSGVCPFRLAHPVHIPVEFTVQNWIWSLHREREREEVFARSWDASWTPTKTCPLKALAFEPAFQGPEEWIRWGVRKRVDGRDCERALSSFPWAMAAPLFPFFQWFSRRPRSERRTRGSFRCSIRERNPVN